ncbi:hypothetical protein FRC04_004220 [Tulasnella sp. 424]|nr:hypothetical protein FRC04_004220 [Tulasnella sp. 424]
MANPLGKRPWIFSHYKEHIKYAGGYSGVFEGKTTRPCQLLELRKTRAGAQTSAVWYNISDGAHQVVARMDRAAHEAYLRREHYQARAKADDASSLPVSGVTVSITNPSSNVPTPSAARSSKVVKEKRSLLDRWPDLVLSEETCSISKGDKQVLDTIDFAGSLTEPEIPQHEELPEETRSDISISSKSDAVSDWPSSPERTSKKGDGSDFVQVKVEVDDNAPQQSGQGRHPTQAYDQSMDERRPEATHSGYPSQSSGRGAVLSAVKPAILVPDSDTSMTQSTHSQSLSQGRHAHRPPLPNSSMEHPPNDHQPPLARDEGRRRLGKVDVNLGQPPAPAPSVLSMEISPPKDLFRSSTALDTSSPPPNNIEDDATSPDGRATSSRAPNAKLKSRPSWARAMTKEEAMRRVSTPSRGPSTDSPWALRGHPSASSDDNTRDRASTPDIKDEQQSQALGLLSSSPYTSSSHDPEERAGIRKAKLKEESVPRATPRVLGARTTAQRTTAQKYQELSDVLSEILRDNAIGTELSITATPAIDTCAFPPIDDPTARAFNLFIVMSTPNEMDISVSSLDQPIPMSFPALLGAVAPGVLPAQEGSVHISAERARRAPKTGKLGKQWVRRRDNAQFTANPHITAPTTEDLNSPLPPHRPWPQPLPTYIPRRAPAPDWIPPPSIHSEPRLTRKGVRKYIRNAGPYAEQLVRDFEREVTGWLGCDVVVNPDNQQAASRRIGSKGEVFELERTHAQLVWSTDAFPRYILHCVARYHGLVSFSKDTLDGQRHTHILRPRPQLNARVVNSLYTPSATATEVDSGSEVLVSEGDIASEKELEALTEEEDDFVQINRLPSPNVESTLAVGANQASTEDATEGIESLNLEDPTPRPVRLLDRSTVLVNRSLRSGSSPSPSPARRSRTAGRRGQPLRVRPAAVSGEPKAGTPSFYDYLYA